MGICWGDGGCVFVGFLLGLREDRCVVCGGGVWWWVG